MKKIYTLLSLLLLSGCAMDVGLLGYPNEFYEPQSQQDVGVFYGTSVPSDCKQIGLATTNLASTSQGLIDLLRERAAEVGANFVNINSYGYTTGLFGSGDKHSTAIFYVCKNKHR